MAQVIRKSGFPGYGIVYPGGGATGIKVVKTFTQGSTKTVNPDGSTSYSTPPPTIHELHGGGFCYADGRPVTNKGHLENISDPVMKERALKWYDMHGKAISPEDVVVKEEGQEPERPAPAFILSNQLPEGSLEQGTVEIQKEQVAPIPRPSGDDMSLIAKGLTELMDIVKKQGEEIVKLQTGKSTENWRAKQGNTMTNKWHDPEFRKKMSEARKARKESVQATVPEPTQEPEKEVIKETPPGV